MGIEELFILNALNRVHDGGERSHENHGIKNIQYTHGHPEVNQRDTQKDLQARSFMSYQTTTSKNFLYRTCEAPNIQWLQIMVSLRRVESSHFYGNTHQVNTSNDLY